MPTHFILSIHLGTCLDQHPACGLVAIPGSEMERGALELRAGGGRGGALGGESSVKEGRGGIYEESDRCSHRLGMEDLQNCHGRGAAHANRLQGLAISAGQIVVNLIWIAMYSISKVAATDVSESG